MNSNELVGIIYLIVMGLSRSFLLCLGLITITLTFKLPTLTPTLDPYNIKNSQKYALYSSITHCPKACIQNWTCGSISHLSKLTSITYLQNNITKAVGFIAYDPTVQMLITSWRGSSNTQNWIEDFNFQQQPYLHCKDCKIHTGFMVDYVSNQKKLLEKAQAIIKGFKVTKILCTGQSLGGALATVNGIEFVRHFPTIPVEVHNFGSPRVGNAQLAQFLKEKIPTVYRVVHNRDLVPHLPPEMLEYRHNPYEVLFDQAMTNYKICSASGQDPACSNQYAPHYSTDDHDFYFVHIGSPKC